MSCQKKVAVAAACFVQGFTITNKQYETTEPSRPTLMGYGREVIRLLYYLHCYGQIRY